MIVKSKEDRKSLFWFVWFSCHHMRANKILFFFLQMVWMMEKIFIDSIVNFILRPMPSVRYFEPSVHRCAQVIRCCYRKNGMRRLIVAYNDAMRLLPQVPRGHSTSHLFVYSGIPTCEALLRHLMYNFMCHLDEFKNGLFEADPLRSCSRYSFRIRKHWRIYIWAIFKSNVVYLFFFTAMFTLIQTELLNCICLHNCILFF